MKRIRKPLAATITGVLITAGVLLGSVTPASAATVVGVCTIIMGEPHGSTHVSGTINSYGRLTCSLSMPNIHLRAQLEKANGQTWNGNTEDWNNSLAGHEYFSNAAIPCAGNDGTYRTNLAIVLRAPAGVNPAYHAKTYTSIWRGVACGLARTATVDESIDDAEEQVTLTFLDDGTIRETVPEDLTAVEFAPGDLAKFDFVD